MSIDLRALGAALDEYYGITSDIQGNGCEHGFKPATDCPNEGCDMRRMAVLWGEFTGENYG
jgi:hypothetical protein